MGPSFEVLYEDDLRRYFDTQNYEPEIEKMSDRNRGIQEAICKSFINGLEVNGSKITNIYQDKIDNIYDLNIGKNVISDFYTFNQFSKNDNAIKFFHDFLRDARFEQIDDLLYQIAEERFDWFKEQENGLYGSKVYNMDASISMSAPMSSIDELNYEYEEEYLKENFNQRFSQMKMDFEQFRSDIKGINTVIYEGQFKENYFDILKDKIHLYRLKIRELFIEESKFLSEKSLGTFFISFQYSLIEMADYVDMQKEDFTSPKKIKKWSNTNFSVFFNNHIIALEEDYFRLTNRLQRILYDDESDKTIKFKKYERRPPYSERRMYKSTSSFYNYEKAKRTELNINFFNYFQTSDLDINFYGNAFDNKFLVNRIHHHKKNIDAVKSAFDGILND